MVSLGPQEGTRGTGCEIRSGLQWANVEGQAFVCWQRPGLRPHTEGSGCSHVACRRPWRPLKAPTLSPAACPQDLSVLASCTLVTRPTREARQGVCPKHRAPCPSSSLRARGPEAGEAEPPAPGWAQEGSFPAPSRCPLLALTCSPFPHRFPGSCFPDFVSK